jgi:hypothetical protein
VQVLDLRLYRITLLPFAALLIIAAFSLHTPSAAPASLPAAQTFDTAQAAAEMEALAGSYPDRTPGSAGDDALADRLARSAPPGGFAHAGFTSVRIVRSSVETTAGAATVRTVIATRAGTGPGIALIADRGGFQPGDPAASLAATATLLELADIYKTVLTTHPLTLVSTSGGASAMGVVAQLLPPGLEAAIVIGDTADAGGHGPFVVPWSESGALAPVVLRRSVEAAIAAATSQRVADVSLTEQLARLALPISTGEQGPLGAAGIPALLVSADGEAPPSAGAADQRLMGDFGQGLLSATNMLEGASSTLATAPTRDLAFGSQVLSGWAVRAVVGALLLSLLGCTLDVLARVRRRRVLVGRWIVWELSFAAPFALAGVFAASLGAAGLLPATPAAPVTPAQLPVSGEGVASLVSIGLLFVLVWVLRTAARARRNRSGPPEPLGALCALLLVTSATATLLWFANPYTAALLILPAHLWLIVLTRERDRAPSIGALYLLVSVVPLAAAAGLLCSALQIEPLALVWTLVLAVAGGALSPYGLLLASLTAGSIVAAGALLLRRGGITPDERVEVTVRGPLSYAGPGSLGGTQSALHR